MNHKRFFNAESLLAALTVKVITAINPPRGAVGTEIEIQGNGFLNSTGVNFLGAGGAPVRAPQVVETDALIRATVPMGAVTGSVTVLDPDGDQVSPAPFSVVAAAQSVAPENTTKGRAAINALVLAQAAKARNDRMTVVNTFAREAFIFDPAAGVALQAQTRPAGPTATEAQIDQYQSNLYNALPTNLDLVLTRVYGSLVLVSGWTDAARTSQTHYLLRQSGDDFEIVLMVRGGEAGGNR